MNKKIEQLVIIARRDEKSPTMLMFDKIYSSVKEAKAAIEYEAQYFLKAHSFLGNGKSSARWLGEKNNSYYHTVGRDNESCIWQYFVFHR